MKQQTLKYFTLLSVVTFILVILTTCINMFKGYVADGFYLGVTILIVVTLLTLCIGLSYSKWQTNSIIRLLVYLFLLITTCTGNIFSLLMFITILRNEQTSKYGIYNSWENFIYKVRQNKIALIGMVILVYMLTLSITSIFTFDTSLATQNHFNALLQNPSWAHPFGTDDFGRDLFTRIIAGAKLTFFISIVSVIIAVIFGMLLGTLAGYFTKADNGIMRILDVFFAIPSLLLAVAIIASFGASTTNLIIALSIGNIPSFARTMRANVLEVKRTEYVEAAIISGEQTPRILWSYIFPNALAPIIIRFSLNIGAVVLTTSGLSFLGLGVAPEVPEWGNILRTGSTYLETHSNLAIFPGLCIMLLVLAFNFIGDAVRDALDPKVQ